MNSIKSCSKKRKRDSADLSEDIRREVPRSLLGANQASGEDEEEKKDPMIPHRMFIVANDHIQGLHDISMMNIQPMP